MNLWIQLTANEAHDFQVPWEVANYEGNQFYSTATMSNLYFDGRWQLLSFGFKSENRHQIIFQPCEVDLRFINDVESYDPLRSACGRNVLLNQQELVDLIAVFDGVASTMVCDRQRPFPPLHTLTSAEAQQYRLPHDDKQYSFGYITPANDSAEATVNLILLTEKSGTTVGQSAKYKLQVRQFPIAKLSDSSFEPVRDGDNCIALDKEGVKALACFFEQIAASSRNPLTSPFYLFTQYEPIMA